MLNPVTFHGTKPGPKFLVLGAVHGNEKCGTIAINSVIDEIKSGKINLIKGSVTFVPICNPRAYEQDVRFTERNLNRYLVPTEDPPTYEAEIGNELCPILAACDVLLDIHSYTAGGPPFVFAGLNDHKGYLFAASLGDVTIMTGWAQAYAATGRNQKDPSPEQAEESTGTTEYARRFGATSITLECGQHKDPASPKIAYDAIHNALTYLGMTHETTTAPDVSSTVLVTVKSVNYRDEGMQFARGWKHLDHVKTGDVIATRADKSTVAAPHDGRIIMPNTTATVGEECFYLGTEQKLSDVLKPA